MEKIVNILAPEKNVYNLLTQYLANADFEYNLINELPSTPYEDELKWGIANTFLLKIRKR